MATVRANVVQDLNNAIYSLASLNPDNVLAARLNDTWQGWLANYRAVNVLSTDAPWWPVFKGFWAAYAAARTSAATLTERTPPASSIDPTLWKTLLSDVQSHGELLSEAPGEAGRAAVNLATDAAAGAYESARTTIWVAGAIAVGFLLMKWKGRK